MTTEMENYGTMITELVFCQYPDFQKCGTFLIVRQGCSDIPIIMGPCVSWRQGGWDLLKVSGSVQRSWGGHTPGVRCFYQWKKIYIRASVEDEIWYTEACGAGCLRELCIPCTITGIDMPGRLRTTRQLVAEFPASRSVITSISVKDIPAQSRFHRLQFEQ